MDREAGRNVKSNEGDGVKRDERVANLRPLCANEIMLRMYQWTPHREHNGLSSHRSWSVPFDSRSKVDLTQSAHSTCVALSHGPCSTRIYLHGYSSTLTSCQCHYHPRTQYHDECTPQQRTSRYLASEVPSRQAIDTLHIQG
jgi:hypothetical protein